MNKYVLIIAIVLCLIWGLQSAHAVDEVVTGQETTTQSSDAAGTSASSDMQKSDPKKEEKRRAILSMKDRTLEKLYKTNPEAKAEVESAVGYAVFDATGVNVIMFVGVKGKGVVVDNSNNKITYMHMARAGTGPGVGYKEYQLVLVFKNKKMFDEFTTIGLDAGASADATMKVKGEGVDAATAISFNPYIKAYQITEKGLLLQANWGGTKFLKDSELNK
jgi:lipid-binding SYLF domain-containing protein